MSVWTELKRRNVVKVGAAYAVLGWLILQVANNLFPPLGLPPWTQTLVAALLLLGFPFALLLAWIYEITPDGIKRTSDVSQEQSVRHVTSQRLNYVVTGLLVLAVAWIVLDDYVVGRSERTASSSEVGANADAAPVGGVPGAGVEEPVDGRLPNSVAVLPFENLSSDPEDAYFAVGIHEEILNQLGKIRSLDLIARTSVLQYQNNRPPIPEIAETLNVEAVMEGSVRYAGNQIQVAVRLIDGATGSRMWSETYPGDVSDLGTIFALQADIAMNVANALRAELTPAELASIEELPTDSPDAYADYLAAQEAGANTLTLEALTRSRVLIDSALKRDPNFALAWVEKAGIHGGINLVALDRVTEELDTAERAALRAIELEPDLAAAHAALGFILSQRKLIDAELAYRRAGEVSLGNLSEAGAYSIMLMSVGNFARACEVGEASRNLDPLNWVTRGFLVSCYGLNGNMEAAVAEHRRGRALYGDFPLGDEHMLRLRLGAGDAAAALELASSNAIDTTARDNFASPSEALAALRVLRASADQPGLRRIALWTASFGDFEQAFEITQGLVMANRLNAYLVWYPQMAGMRRLPEFKTLMREAGFVEYWDEFGWPELCRRTTGEDFECS